MHHCSWDCESLKCFNDKKFYENVYHVVYNLQKFPNYAIGCPLIVECFLPVLGKGIAMHYFFWDAL